MYFPFHVFVSNSVRVARVLLFELYVVVPCQRCELTKEIRKIFVIDIRNIHHSFHKVQYLVNGNTVK